MLIAIFKPGPSYTFTLDDSLLEFGENVAIIAAEYGVLKEVTQNKELVQ